MEKQGKRQLRVVLVPCPIQGHINPMLQLGTILYSKGFSITVAHTNFNSPNPSNHPNFNFLLVPDVLNEFQSSSGDMMAVVLRLNDNCKAPFQECLAQLMKQHKTQDEVISCIIYDEIMYFAESVANQLKLPSIILRPLSANFFISRNALLQFKAGGNLFLTGLGSEEIVPNFHPFRWKDLPVSKFGSLETMSQLFENASHVGNSAAVIVNTMDFLEQPSLARILQQCQVPLFSIGLYKFAPAFSSSLLKEDMSCITWLDKQTKNSAIYVSLGSVTLIDENELAEMAWGLANSEQPFLWVVRPGSVRGSDWLESLPEGFIESIGERGCIVKWAPQKEVLAHQSVGGFWSHCGWNSTMESISQGVPVICRPNSGDQKVNARYLSHVWKVGLELENGVERGEVERVVRRLMVEKEGMEMRQRAKDLKKKAEHCIGKGGSSYNSLNKLVKFINSF
ncbi:UDP-glycosyltransferase [Melia azedarach]|uniref:UDP-glycosyltransferase n=1 Tax=Melia azedarach TaxID=155640 RepID=A0ACC1YPI7_MELAZ|nr:UDP-glycosyltransferase [Melia azedarach]